MIKENIKQLKTIKTKKEDLNKKIKKLNEEEEYLEGLIINELQLEGLTKVTALGITASIKTDIYPKIDNWDQTLAFILKEKRYSLLAKKINSSLWREMVEDEMTVEGVSSYEKQSLLFRRTR